MHALAGAARRAPLARARAGRARAGRAPLARVHGRGGAAAAPAAPAGGRQRGRCGRHAERLRTCASATAAESTTPFSSTAGDSPLAYEIVRGANVKPPEDGVRRAPPPTAVMLHGVLGARRNLTGFARQLARAAPDWQFLLVDLRNHGASAALAPQFHPAPHCVMTAAQDVHALLRHLRIFPRALIGHSFGAKVALEMVELARPLPLPVQVWALDTAPGPVAPSQYLDNNDSPADLIPYLQSLDMPLPTKEYLTNALMSGGFSQAVAAWAATNLCETEDGEGVDWLFNLDGVADMYYSYAETDLWPTLDNLPEGALLNFVKAERSLHAWGPGEYERMTHCAGRAAGQAAGIFVHTLPDAGHWVHIDNPKGLIDIMSGVGEADPLSVPFAQWPERKFLV